MAHSRLFMWLKEAQATVAEAVRRDMPIDEVAGERMERAKRQRQTRRRFLKATAGGLAGAGLAAAGVPRARASQQSIVIVGGGLAGISCAWQLWLNGYTSTVYEASTSWPASGRCVTHRGDGFTGWQELCGEFISSEHCRMRALAKRFAPPGPLGNGLIYTTGGQKLFFADESGDDDGYTWGSLPDPAPPSVLYDWASFAYELFHANVLACPWREGWDHDAGAACPGLDSMSAEAWISNNIDPSSADLGRLMRLVSVAENAGDPSDQSALNLIYLLGYNASVCGGYQGSQQPQPSGTDEYYQIWQGNDQVLKGMASELPPDTVQTGYTLCKVVCNTTAGNYSLHFNDCGGKPYVVSAEQVVLAIPFKTLRNVDLSKAHITERKMDAINQLGIGANVKIFTQLPSPPPWANDSSGGNGFIDIPVPGACAIAQQTWPAFDPSAVQEDAVLVNNFGGEAGTSFGTVYQVSSPQGLAVNTPIADMALAMAQKLWPSLYVDTTTNPCYYHWPWGDPNIGGSWSYYRPGQYTQISGIEPVPEGPGRSLHFAGEHTSLNFQGYMEGAVESGYRAAAEIMGTSPP